MRTSLGVLGLVAVLSLVAVGCSGGGGEEDLGRPDVPDVGGEDEGPLPDLGPKDEGPGIDTNDVVTPPTDEGPKDVVVTCTKDKDCDNVAVELGACQVKVCDSETSRCVPGWNQECALPEGTEVLFQGFEAGLGGWTVEDPNLGDQVTWSVSQARKAFGAASLYFGDPGCATYFNGAMDVSCVPLDPDGKDATSVRAYVLSPWIDVPDTMNTFLLSWYAWVDSEPMWDVSEPGFQQPDQFRVVVLKPGAAAGEKVFGSEMIEKTTNGLFLHFVADLTQYAGERISIQLLFDTLDGNSNRYEGVYVDDVAITTTSEPACTPGSECDSDGETCTDDLCQKFANNTSKGACSFPVKPGCEEPLCTEANAAQKCAVADPCKIPKCVEGQCTWEDKPEGECCRTDSLLDAGFEGDAGGFELYAYQDNPSVRWQLHTKRAATGTKALYYGDTVKGNYDSGGMNFGFATTPGLTLPGTGYPFLTFKLWLSTEFDTAQTTKYYNPLGTDFFQVEVIENLGDAGEKATRVWSSDNIYGSTRGAWIPVGVDLTAFAGKEVWVRFRFDTGDEMANQFEGVYVDDVKVVRDTCVRRGCAGPADCLIDGVCRTGTCTAEGACNVTVSGTQGCCSVTADCDDGNDCTTDGCLDYKCENTPFQKPGCCVPLRLGEWDFDAASSLEQILFTVADDSVPGPGGVAARWQLSDLQAHSGSDAVYFGNEMNYDNGGLAAGSVTTPTFKVPLDGAIRLSLWVWLDIETDPAKDVFRVDVMDGPVATPVVTKAIVPADKYRTWFEVPAVDLSQYHNRTIALRLSFNSVDAGNNTGLGVFVDDLAIRKVCP